VQGNARGIPGIRHADAMVGHVIDTIAVASRETGSMRNSLLPTIDVPARQLPCCLAGISFRRLFRSPATEVFSGSKRHLAPVRKMSYADDPPRWEQSAKTHAAQRFVHD